MSAPWIDPTLRIRKFDGVGKRLGHFLNFGEKRTTPLFQRHNMRFKSKEETESNFTVDISLLNYEGKHIVTSLKQTDSRLENICNSLKIDFLAEVPRSEWWDFPISQLVFPIPPSSGPQAAPVKYESTFTPTNLIFHQQNVEPLVNVDQSSDPVVYLTEREKRKINRMKRLEKERAKQDKIRMGLVKPPEPKLKISNMFRVLKEEAIANPTAVEEKVRAQMAERLEKHELENQKRHEEAEEGRTKRAADKWINKSRDLALATALYRFERDVGSQIAACKPALLRIEKNAQQMHVRGRAVLCTDGSMPSFIVVHGSHKAIRKYDNVLMRRIKWKQILRGESNHESEEEDSDSESKALASSGYVQKLWEGEEAKSKFMNFSVIIGQDKGAIESDFAKKNALDYLTRILQK
eukprot:GDKJ01029088.1.p1 GENE.GDKJ01029088.1~~GDKJ01029088.1.p1  ORF type:complete len:408 (-),score=79.74 GDKJ01029088.1:50-1273(-)